MNDVAVRNDRPGLQEVGNLNAEIGSSGLPPSLQILLNEGLYQRVKQLSVLMAGAQGMTPAHLLGKGEACFAVINMALDWKLNPHFCARHTYQTPGGSIGFDGALVQAILERSGQFIGSPKMEYRGDWSKLTGKFQVKTNAHGKSFVQPTWTSQDATGLGIIVRWRVRGEEDPRVWPGEDEPFWLTQCYPLNSPLWATDAKTQIAYLAIRRFANLTSPGILGAASFDHDELLDASERAIDVTEPQRVHFADGPAQEQQQNQGPQFPVWDLDGAEEFFGSAARARDALMLLMRAAAAESQARLEGIWEDNMGLLDVLDTTGNGPLEHELSTAYADLLADRQAKDKAAAAAVQQPKRRAPRAAAKAAEGSPERDGAPATPAPGEPARGETLGSVKGMEDKLANGEPTMGRPASEEDPGDRRAPAEAEGGPGGASLPPSGAARDDDRFPGDLPAGQKLGDPPTQAGNASPATGPSGDATGSGEEDQKPAGNGPTATSAASPSEQTQAGSVGDGTRVINPVMKAGKPDWKTWLVALAGPKMRQQKTTTDLAWFLADNAAHLDEAQRACPAEFRDFERAKAAQWNVVEQLEASGNG